MSTVLDKFEEDKPRFNSLAKWQKRLSAYLIIEMIALKYKQYNFVLGLHDMYEYNTESLILTMLLVLTWLGLGLLLFLSYKSEVKPSLSFYFSIACFLIFPVLFLIDLVYTFDLV